MKIQMQNKRFLIFLLTISVIAAVLSGCAATATKAKLTEKEQEAVEKIAGDLFLEGKMAEAKENWAESIGAYTEALQYDPRSDEIAAALAKVFFMDKKIRSAHYYTKMAIRLKPKEPDYWRFLQLIEQQEGRYGEAAEALKMYMKLNPEYAFTDLIKLSQYYFALGKKNEAKKILMKRAGDIHTPASEIYEIANRIALNGLKREAISIYKNLIERDPLDVQAWIYLGKLYSDSGRDEDAMQTYLGAYEKNPDNLFVILTIGNHCLDENNWDCSTKYYEKAYSIGREKIEDEGIVYTDIMRTLTAVYFYAGRDSDAHDMHDLLKQMGENNANLYFSLGKAMNYMERFEEAVDYYKMGFDKDIRTLSEESIFKAYVGIARAMIKLDRSNEALNIIHEDAKKNIKDDIALKELEASIYMELKQYDDALSIYEWLNAADPENRGYFLSLSLIYDLTGQFENAEKVLIKILEMLPEDPLALNNLAYMYLENNVNISKALEMVRQALIFDPENGAYLDTLGWAYYKMGKYKKARKNIENALKRADKEDKGIIFEHYGDVMMKLKKKKEALEAYRNAIEFGESEDKILPKINNITE